MPTNSTTPELLSDEALREIEARRWAFSYGDERLQADESTRSVILTVAERDALCQTVRAARAQTAHFESPDGEGKCRFCGNLRDAPHGHIQKCYCIPTIRQYREENAALRDQLAQVEKERDKLRADLELGEEP